MRIDVLAQDIASATAHADNCPIAKAIQRVLPGCGAVVGATRIVVYRRDCFDPAVIADLSFERRNLPMKVTFFVFDYDHHVPVEPFHFELPLLEPEPEPVLQPEPEPELVAV